MEEQVKHALSSYDRNSLSIGTICSHSALQIIYGAKREGFRTVGIVRRDRRLAYDAFPAAKPDEYIEVNTWKEILDESVQQKLRSMNTIVVPHGSFVEYVGPENMLNSFCVPMLGNRQTLRWENDRTKQREWLQVAGVKLPKSYSSPDEIDGKVFVKFSGARGGKGFFTASSKTDYHHQLRERIKRGLLTQEDAENSTIQEFLPGVRYYPHYFFSPFDSDGLRVNGGVLQFMGFDKRIEPVDEAYRALPDIEETPEVLDYTITGNMAVTIRESLLPDILKMGVGVVNSAQKLMPPGMIGPFALETFYHPDTGFTVFEISARIVAGTNPFGEGSEYSIWTFGRPISTGRRIAMEIKAAAEKGELEKIVS